MKKLHAILSLVLAIVLCAPLAVSAGWWGTVDIAPVRITTDADATPTIDGEIASNEGWSSAVDLNNSTFGYFWDIAPLTTEGTIQFAADNEGLYFAVSLTENGGAYRCDENGNPIMSQYADGNSFVFSTGEDNVDGGYGFNGDVIALGFDAAGALYENGVGVAPWYCVGVYPDQTVGVYRENVHEGDITSEVTAAGKGGLDVNGVAGGCIFEVFIPWYIIIDDVNSAAASAGVDIVLTKDDIIKAGGVSSRATVIYQDRRYIGNGEVETWGRFITVPEFLPNGSKGSSGSGTNLESYAISINISSDPAAPAHEHVFGDWAVTRAPTCTGSGKETRTCTLDPLGHDYEMSVVDPTCTEEGYTRYVCTRCRDSYKDIYISAKGHTPGKWEVLTDPTVDEPGVQVRYCTVCHEEVERTEIPVLDPENPFDDVPDGKWFAAAALWCNAKGYITGTAEKTFSPDTNLTRAMFVQILAKVAEADLDSCEYAGKFDDVKADDWFAKAVQWAIDNDLTGGTSATTFSPNDPVTREQLATFFFAYSKFMNYDTSSRGDKLAKYEDKDQVSSWARSAMEWAVAEGLISGTAETILSPGSTATRAQAAQIFMNFVKDYAAKQK